MSILYWTCPFTFFHGPSDFFICICICICIRIYTNFIHVCSTNFVYMRANFIQIYMNIYMYDESASVYKKLYVCMCTRINFIYTCVYKIYTYVYNTYNTISVPRMWLRSISFDCTACMRACMFLGCSPSGFQSLEMSGRWGNGAGGTRWRLQESLGRRQPARSSQRGSKEAHAWGY